MYIVQKWRTSVIYFHESGDCRKSHI